MLVNSVQFNSYNNYPKVAKQPAFEGGKPIDLNYILKNRAHLLPPRILHRVEEIISEKPDKLPTLMEVHKKTYAPLMGCKSLEEAQQIFPEFLGIKEGNVSFKRCTGNIRSLRASGKLEDGFSLKLLQEFWVNLKSQDDFAKELGLENRSSLTWILQKVGFVSYNTNYKTLLKASDPETHSLIAAKTKAWNAAHPDLMYKRNKHAAQYMKKPENREAHSLRMKKHFEEHPERREQVSKNSRLYWANPEHRAKQSQRGLEYHISHPERKKEMSEYSKAAWSKASEVRNIMSKFFREYVKDDVILGARLRNVFDKRAKGLSLTEYDVSILRKFNKDCLQAHPEIKESLSKAFKELKKETTKSS